MAKKLRIWKPTFNTASSVKKKDDVDLPQCVICYKVLGNDSLKLAKLKLHLSKCHPALVQKDKSYFERHLSSFKRQRLDPFGTYHERTANAVRASYIVAYKVAQAKNFTLLLNNCYYLVQKKWLGLLSVRMQLGNLMIYPYLMTLYQDVLMKSH